MAASAANFPILRRVACAALLVGAITIGGSSLAGAQGTTSTETPTTSQAPTTETPTTTPTSELPTTTIDSGGDSDDDIAWGWIAIAVLGGLLLLLIIINAIRAGQNRSRAKGSWRGQSLQICQDASATRDLILQTPGQGDETARWAAVEQRTDALTADLDNLTGNAPDSRSADASASLRQALRSLRFSVEANRLIREGDAPDARQLAAADADIGERESDFEAALGTLRAVSVD